MRQSRQQAQNARKCTIVAFFVSSTFTGYMSLSDERNAGRSMTMSFAHAVFHRAAMKRVIMYLFIISYCLK